MKKWFPLSVFYMGYDLVSNHFKYQENLKLCFGRIFQWEWNNFLIDLQKLMFKSTKIDFIHNHMPGLFGFGFACPWIAWLIHIFSTIKSIKLIHPKICRTETQLSFLKQSQHREGWKQMKPFISLYMHISSFVRTYEKKKIFRTNSDKND